MSEESNIRGQRVRVGKGHESIRREALQDTRLSFKAGGILGYLLSLPDNWTTNADRLGRAREGKEGRTAILSGLKELEEVGYLVRRRVHLGGGKWEWLWRYGDDPDALRAELGLDQAVHGSPDDGSPVVTSPTGGAPTGGQHADIEVQEVEVLGVETPDLEANASKSCPTADHEDQKMHQTDLFGAGVQPPAKGHGRNGAGHGSSPPSEGDSRATTAGSTPAVLRGPSRAELAAVHAALFDEFWSTYAHKIDKGAARKAWAVACRKADPREVINAAARFAASRRGEDPQFTPHASTWLNGERWLDEPSYVRNGGGVGGDRRSNGHQAYQNPPESAYVRTKPRHYTSSEEVV